MRGATCTGDKVTLPPWNDRDDHPSIRTPMRPLLVLSLVSPLVLLPQWARRARAADVILDHLPPGAIKLDGKIGKEWPGTTPASETIKSGKVSANFGAGYDDKGIWIAADVAKEGSIARTSAFGPNEDCVGLVIAFPKNGAGKPGEGMTVHEVGIYAGVPGSSSGAVRFRGGPNSGKTISGAQIVEAPRKGGGYTVEAFIPWSAFAEASKVRAGLRGALRVYDGDGTSIRAIRATAAGSVESPAGLGNLLIEPEQSLPQALASKKQSLKDVTFEISADVAGDALNERLLFIGRQLYVLGPAYKEGKQWLAMDLGVDPVSIEARDANGDGKADLLLTTRVKAGATTREAMSVWVFGGTKGSELPAKQFAHETLVQSGSDSIRDLISFSGKKLTITYDKPKGFTVDTYKEPVATDIDPILFPWGTVKERTFAWNGSTFVKDKEVTQKGIAPTAPAVVEAPKTPMGTPLPPPSDLVNAAIKQFKKDKGLPESATARIETDATIVPKKKGRVALFGKDLVIATGDGGYATISMARFASDKDIIEITARDLTGDGRDDIIVRGILRAKLTGPGTADKEVLREVMFIYQPKAQGTGLAINQVFGVETSRAIGKDLVEANFRIVTAKGSSPGKIEIMKGSAKGFSKANWPFNTEQPSPGLEPLLLPWGADSTITYAWDGAKFAR